MIGKVMLGNTGAQVSELALGTMYMGSRMQDDVSEKVLDLYLDMGGNFVDTANNYAHWVEGCDGSESERFLGRWLRKTGKRNQVFLATKVGSNNKYLPKGLKAEQIIGSCEKSLKQLQTDVIDLFYAHMDDRHTPLEESLEAFEKLRREGKVRYLGASNFTPWRMEQSRMYSCSKGYEPYVCLQERFTYLRPRPCELDRYHIDLNDDIMDYAANRQLTLLAYSPLLQGFYAHPERSIPPLCAGDFNAARLQELQAVAEEIPGITLNQLVLLWMRFQSTPVIPLISGENTEQLQENILCLQYELTAEQLTRLNQA